MLFKGRVGHKVHIVTSYQLVVQKAMMIGSVYQKHRWHYLEEGLPPNMDPITKFRNDLVAQLWSWRQDHEWLIIFIDANKNTANGPLNTALLAPGLVMREGVYSLASSFFATNSNLSMRWPSWMASHWCGVSHSGPSVGSWYLDFYDPLSRGSSLLYHWELLESLGWRGYV
jgi:hypothetical protein